MAEPGTHKPKKLKGIVEADEMFFVGVDKRGEEIYQVTLGGSADEHTSIGEIVGRGFASDEITDAIETVVDTYLGLRQSKDENFLSAYRRVGAQPFKEALYGSVDKAA